MQNSNNPTLAGPTWNIETVGLVFVGTLSLKAN